VVDARHRGLSFLHGGEGRRAALGVFFERQRQRAEKVVSAIDAQCAILLMREFDGFAGVTAMAGQRWQGNGMGAQGDGVVGGDDALVAQAQATGKIEAARQGAKVARGVGGGAGEALVVVGAEASEHGIGLLQSGGVGEAKFANQTILKGAPGAFDAALGLGGVGGDLLDAESLERAPELGGRLFSGELFGEGPVGIVALEAEVRYRQPGDRVWQKKH